MYQPLEFLRPLSVQYQKDQSKKTGVSASCHRTHDANANLRAKRKKANSSGKKISRKHANVDRGVEVKGTAKDRYSSEEIERLYKAAVAAAMNSDTQKLTVHDKVSGDGKKNTQIIDKSEDNKETEGNRANPQLKLNSLCGASSASPGVHVEPLEAPGHSGRKGLKQPISKQTRSSRKPRKQSRPKKAAKGLAKETKNSTRRKADNQLAFQNDVHTNQIIRDLKAENDQLRANLQIQSCEIGEENLRLCSEIYQLRAEVKRMQCELETRSNSPCFSVSSVKVDEANHNMTATSSDSGDSTTKPRWKVFNSDVDMSKCSFFGYGVEKKAVPLTSDVPLSRSDSFEDLDMPLIR